MALDYLPIQGSSVPSEYVFSSSAETDTKRRNRIKPELMEALQMLKFALKAQRLDFSLGREISEDSLGIESGGPVAPDAPDALDELLKANGDAEAWESLAIALGDIDDVDDM